jgi:hypothetical protein
MTKWKKTYQWPSQTSKGHSEKDKSYQNISLKDLLAYVYLNTGTFPVCLLVTPFLTYIWLLYRFDEIYSKYQTWMSG